MHLIQTLPNDFQQGEKVAAQVDMQNQKQQCVVEVL
jgi:hypothetical protein